MKKLIDFIQKYQGTKHTLVVLGFVLFSFAIYYPVLQGKALMQSDSIQYAGMSRQMQEERENNNKELYWIDNAFGGMPTFQLGAKYPYDILTPIHKLFRLLPSPIFLLFLYFLGAYLFLYLFGLPIPYAVLGALAYGLSTYLLIIIQVGHNTKAQALGYLPFVFAAAHTIFTKHRWWGFVFTSLALAMQIRANHYQMTYYMLMLLGLYVGTQGWVALKQGKIKPFVHQMLLLVGSGFLALTLNATSLLATKEYTAFSTRGQSELTQTSNGLPAEPSTGLDYAYITQYSYGVFESLNLIAPRVQGGASSEDLGTTSSLYASLIQRGASPRQAREFVRNAPTYWGDQPILEAPAYVGVVVVFLAFLSLYFPKTKYSYWLYTGIVFSLLLSWGKNFDFLTRFFVDYFPLYNKFRAVSSIQVVLEFCFPVLAMISLHKLLQTPAKVGFQILKKAGAYFLGGLIVLYFSKGLFSFSGPNDAYYGSIFGAELMEEIRFARQDIFESDVFRAIAYVALVISFLLLFYVNKIRRFSAFIGIGVLLLIDLLQIANRYVDRDLFVSPRRVNQSFEMLAADEQILQDTSHYRVYEPRLGLQGARTAYHHNAVGGYHGAKPRRFEEVIELMESQKADELLNILNVKYILYQDEEGKTKAYKNSENFGPAWMVQQLEMTSSADEIYQSLTQTNLHEIALVEGAYDKLPKNYIVDSLAQLKLVYNHPEKKTYQISTPNEAFVVFSEMYYPQGWEAVLNGESTSIYPVDFILRGVYVPAGSHELTFRFEPEVVRAGGKWQLMGVGLFLVAIVFGVWSSRKRQLL